MPDVVVEEAHPDFRITGLKVSSVIRLDKVATILRDLVIGEIGEIGGTLKSEINSRLYKTYGFPT